MKIFTKKNVRKFVYLKVYSIALVLIAIVAWETSGVREQVLNFFESETIILERQVIELEETRVEFFAGTKRALDAGEVCKMNEAKKMRLEEIAEEAKTLQAELEDPLR